MLLVYMYEMSFMVYFEFWLSWFWFGRKFLIMFCNVNVSFCNSRVCVSTSKWDSSMYMYRTF